MAIIEKRTLELSDRVITSEDIRALADIIEDVASKYIEMNGEKNHR